MLLDEEDNGDTLSDEPNFDQLYEDLGLPELKGFSVCPAPVSVDEAQMLLYVRRELEPDVMHRLNFLVANYREFAQACIRITRSENLQKPGSDDASDAIDQH